MTLPAIVPVVVRWPDASAGRSANARTSAERDRRLINSSLPLQNVKRAISKHQWSSTTDGPLKPDPMNEPNDSSAELRTGVRAGNHQHGAHRTKGRAAREQ